MTHTETPYWFKLITAWCAAGRTGLSIPFLAGAKTFVDNEDNKPSYEDVLELLREVFEYPVEGELLRIKWCREVQAFVVGICEQEDLEDGLTFGSVHVSGAVLMEYGNTQQEVIEGLASEYRHVVEEGLFSVRRKEWQEFDAADKFFIFSSTV